MMHQWLTQGAGIFTHMAYLQAFYDLGVFGGIVFLFVTFLLPATLIVIRAAKAPLAARDIFVILLFLYMQSEALTHGAPYGWMPMTAMLLVYLLLFNRPETDEVEDEAEPIEAVS
jgi:hypothetical protein